jgi:hypothetical protein
MLTTTWLDTNLTTAPFSWISLILTDPGQPLQLIISPKSLSKFGLLMLTTRRLLVRFGIINIAALKTNCNTLSMLYTHGEVKPLVLSLGESRKPNSPYSPFSNNLKARM